MKFGKYLKSQIKPEFATKYVDYGRLKDLIAALAVVETRDDVGIGESGFGERVTSLSMTPNMPESAKFEGKDVTETDFFEMLEAEMKKVDEFTHEKVKEAVARVDQLEAKVQPNEDVPEEVREELRKEASSIGDQFLAIEKYVNINYLAVHKILKKHDKTLPIPCRRFYITRLHNQRWVKNDYSRLFVRLSQIHSLLRGDKTNNKASEAGGQTFVRTTKKYWVRTEDISRVKHIVLQNLPIFQHDINSLAGDSQLTNSVYFDNESLELYHGRLDKTPGAIAIRFRWYATEEPTLVFVERKTHRESWTGEISVKERFTLKENQVLPFLQGKYTVKDMLDEMKKKGKSEADMANVEQLFTEIYSQIDSKQLRPCMRTRYNRTAYQIPNDATVRISLDTNLTMMTENPKVGPDCATSGRWYRDPTVAVPPTEITRFPHAILEVKLSLKEGEKEPQWVTDLLASGMATEVHKFSKFIHGCATLLTDSVRAVPYWVDDPSIRPSILRSQPKHVSAMKRIADAPLPDAHPSHIVDDDDDEGQLPFGQGRELMLMQRKPSLGGGSVASPNYGAFQSENTPLIGGRPNGYHGSSSHPVSSWKDCCRGFLWRGGGPERGNNEVPGYKPRKVPMKIEPKVFLANERTMLSWLHMSVTLGTIAAALIGANHPTSTLVGMLLLPVSVLFAAYALVTFYWRGRGIALRQSDVPFHDLVGPTVLASVLVLALSAIFFVHLVESSSVTSPPGTSS